jgi:hypothetical protein
MRTNRACWRALHSLSHSVSLGAVLLLLLNDHVLRLHWPSWWTGKLGDAVWLVFAPLIAALVVALFIPARWQRQERIVGILAFAFVGLWFALGKTVPAVYDLNLALLNRLLGWQGSYRLDATDLLALPALMIGWWLWQSVPTHPVRLQPIIGWSAALVGILSTLANSCGIQWQDIGITYLCQADDYLVASTSPIIEGPDGTWRFDGTFYISRDGGQTWSQPPELKGSGTCTPQIEPQLDARQPWLLTTTDGNWRFVPGQAIYRYDEGGRERFEFNLATFNLYSDRRKFAFEGFTPVPSVCPSSPVGYEPGPLHAIASRSGNLLVAMGQDGLLLRTTDGTWQWVEVGGYRYEPSLMLNVDPGSMLRPEIITAMGITLLLPLIFATHLRGANAFRVFVLLLCLFVWFLGLISNLVTNGFMWELIDLFAPGSIIAIVVVLGLQYALFVPPYRERGLELLMVILCSIAIMAAAFLPFIAWWADVLPSRLSAYLIGAILFVVAFQIGWKYLDRYFGEKPKRKNDDNDDLLAAELLAEDSDFRI